VEEGPPKILVYALNEHDPLDRFDRIADNCFSQVQNTLKDGKSVLIHCQAGMFRSPTLVFYYLTKCEGVHPAEASELVAKLHPNFVENLHINSNVRRQAWSGVAPDPQSLSTPEKWKCAILGLLRRSKDEGIKLAEMAPKEEDFPFARLVLQINKTFDEKTIWRRMMDSRKYGIYPSDVVQIMVALGKESEAFSFAKFSCFGLSPHILGVDNRFNTISALVPAITKMEAGEKRGEREALLVKLINDLRILTIGDTVLIRDCAKLAAILKAQKQESLARKIEEALAS
jgi:hypothetical protein